MVFVISVYLKALMATRVGWSLKLIWKVDWKLVSYILAFSRFLVGTGGFRNFIANIWRDISRICVLIIRKHQNYEKLGSIQHRRRLVVNLVNLERVSTLYLNLLVYLLHSKLFITWEKPTQRNNSKISWINYICV